MSGKRYTEEFKMEAVKQVTERGHPVAEVAGRLGVTAHSLYQWIKKYRLTEPERRSAEDQQGEVRRLKVELKRVTEERDILKNRPTRLPSALMNRNSNEYTGRTQRLWP